MKHNTHIYLASKAIEFLRDSVDNLRYLSGSAVASKTRTKVKQQATDLQRLLRYHQSSIVEASWAPDDVLCDKSTYHTFKLFTREEFPDPEQYTAEFYERNAKKYYRISGSGGLPFKVDHLARIIADLVKLRAYNDHFSQKQIMYLYMMISHYVADAHVPMHCDLRDDPPSDSDTKKPRPIERYYTDALHGKIEDLWDKACTPAAVAENIVIADTFDDHDQDTALTPHTRFTLKDKSDIKLIRPYSLTDRGMMDFMVDICTQSKERSLKLFPLDNPAQWDQTAFPAITREVFAETISNLITIYLWMWVAGE
ncbi:MAG: hypothetical protein JXA71_02095 [Chitinispirillaceae bacterium]|nr:hypothetical protein [Chitinispirillaceae bacterium]